MQLNEFERLSLINQFEILAMLSEDEYDAKRYRRNIQILADGYEYLYDDIYRMATGNEVLSKAEAEEVLDILSMFERIGYAIDDGVSTEGIDLHALEFPGFDGNNESNYMAFAKFYCNDGERFRRVGTGIDGFNSHAPLLPHMRRMLEEFNKSADQNSLTHEDLVRIAGAR